MQSWLRKEIKRERWRRQTSINLGHSNSLSKLELQAWPKCSRQIWIIFFLWSVHLDIGWFFIHIQAKQPNMVKIFSLPHACIIKGQHAPILCTVTLHPHTQFPSHFNSRLFYKNKTNNSQSVNCSGVFNPNHKEKEKLRNK